MWNVYEYQMSEDGFIQEVFFGMTNDPINAEELSETGYLVYDTDTLEPFPGSM